MLFTFKIDKPKREIICDEAILNHIENILKFITLADDNALIDPDFVKTGSNSYSLFSNTESHFWAQKEMPTTKEELSFLKKVEDQDQYYDLDVLKKTEPRIEFIHSTLTLINSLSNRTEIFNDIEENDIELINNDNLLDQVFGTYLSSLFSLVQLFEKGNKVNPTRFFFHSNIEKEIFIGKKTKSCSEIFRNFLQCFSLIANFEKDGDSIVEFSLKDYDHRTQKSQGDPFEILSVLSRQCNAKCDFCYVLGNPSNTTIKLVKFTNKKSEEEAKIRLKYFNNGLRLPQPTYDLEEITNHPSFFDLCKEIRKKSDKCISLTTNGYMLNEENVVRLKELFPVDISLSLNSSNPATRKWLMKGNYNSALSVLPLLEKHRIPCVATIAAWPKISFADMIETIEYANSFNLRSISVLLGGYTRFFPSQIPYSIPDYWNQVIENIAPLREKISTPLILQPRLYEEQTRYKELGRSIVTGIFKYSPAYHSELKVYDEIVEINNIPIITRNQCMGLLALLREKQMQLKLLINREDRRFECLIDPGENQDENYIYGYPFNDKYGIHLIGDNIKVSSIRDIYDKVRKHKAKKILFLTSMIVRPFLVNFLKEFSFLCEHEADFYLEIPPNDFFGGNIIMGDMLVLDDFYKFIKEFIKKETDIDLILLPSGPFNYGGWFRDLKGQPFELLRRSFKIPIELIIADYFE